MTESSLTEQSEFGQVVSLNQKKTSTVAADLYQELAQMKRRNIGVAIASVALAFLNFAWQFTHPITPIQLLSNMQETSSPVTVIGKNDKPSLVDFWAPWCENCKMEASTLAKIEQEYGDRVNFVMINGDKNEAWPYIEAFGVDAIPHMALVDSSGNVETALIGIIPKHIIEADLDVLLETHNGRPNLPYKMLDVFASRPEQRHVEF